MINLLLYATVTISAVSVRQLQVEPTKEKFHKPIASLASNIASPSKKYADLLMQVDLEQLEDKLSEIFQKLTPDTTNSPNKEQNIGEVRENEERTGRNQIFLMSAVFTIAFLFCLIAQWSAGNAKKSRLKLN